MSSQTPKAEPKFQLSKQVKNKIQSECEAWASWNDLDVEMQEEVIEGYEEVARLAYLDLAKKLEEAKEWQEVCESLLKVNVDELESLRAELKAIKDKSK